MSNIGTIKSIFDSGLKPSQAQPSPTQCPKPPALIEVK